MRLIRELIRRLGKRTIAKADSLFGSVRIFEETRGGDRLRVLSVEGSYQSATYLDRRWNRAPFEYLRRFFVIFELGLPMNELCMLGGGGYAFPKDLIAHHPGVQLDVVEIDPTITQLAREYFFLDRCIETYHCAETGLLNLVQDEAVSYLERCKEEGRHFDALINDCFAAETAAQAFLTPSTAHLVRQCLTERGVYLANVIASYEMGPSEHLMQVTDALSHEFSHVYALPCTHERDDEPYNMVILAADEKLPLRGALTLYELSEEDQPLEDGAFGLS